MDVPDQKGRFDILKVHAKNKKLSDEVELLEVALRTPGFSGADLANLLNEVRGVVVVLLCHVVLHWCALFLLVSRQQGWLRA